jgi:hypothetical protein
MAECQRCFDPCYLHTRSLTQITRGSLSVATAVAGHTTTQETKAGAAFRVGDTCSRIGFAYTTGDGRGSCCRCAGGSRRDRCHIHHTTCHRRCSCTRGAKGSRCIRGGAYGRCRSSMLSGRPNCSAGRRCGSVRMQSSAGSMRCSCYNWSKCKWEHHAQHLMRDARHSIVCVQQHKHRVSITCIALSISLLDVCWSHLVHAARCDSPFCCASMGAVVCLVV